MTSRLAKSRLTMENLLVESVEKLMWAIVFFFRKLIWTIILCYIGSIVSIFNVLVRSLYEDLVEDSRS